LATILDSADSTQVRTLAIDLAEQLEEAVAQQLEWTKVGGIKIVV